jgi:hypothetical protein
MMQRTMMLGVCALGLAVLAPSAGAAQVTAEPALEVRVNDLTPQFLRFYEAAVAEEADADRRWELWQEHYGFAALPPVAERDSLARAMLDEAWERYPEVIDRVRAGVAAMDPAPEPALRQVAELLEADRPITVDLLVYVGMLEGNAFFAAQEGQLFVAIPIEDDPEHRGRTLVHEFTHAVHHVLAGLSGGWERTIAQTLFLEGLAAHATAAILPGGTPATYLDHRPGWLAEADARGGEILRGIRPHLREDASEQVMRFTMGEGTTGTEREAYYAGWVVVERLLAEGHTLAELARIPEEAIPEVVEGALEALISP